MTFIVYIDEVEKVLDVFPGCWEDIGDEVSNLWTYYCKQNGQHVHAYCINHHCSYNHAYKPTWYTRPEDR